MQTELVIYGWAKYNDIHGTICLRRCVVQRIHGLSLDEAQEWKAANSDRGDVELLYRTEERL